MWIQEDIKQLLQSAVYLYLTEWSRGLLNIPWVVLKLHGVILSVFLFVFFFLLKNKYSFVETQTRLA